MRIRTTLAAAAFAATAVLGGAATAVADGGGGHFHDGGALDGAANVVSGVDQSAHGPSLGGVDQNDAFLGGSPD